ncbi:Mitochondrial intermediate peptidase [Orbilia ellipsospora]|uniref:Mitochondrial intermediate peptidase n=1 Tax=Orbilia ellipsospora TaxID=2528407 RepID=A0AAV9XAI0_9PEZI
MQPAARSQTALRILSRQRLSLTATIRPLPTQNYICNDCRRRYRSIASLRYPLRQGITSTPSVDLPSNNSAESTSPLPPPIQHGATGAHHDDALLRAIFDDPSTFASFNSVRKPETGLFQNRFLNHPNGFAQFANICLQRAQKVVERVSAATKPAEQYKVIRDLDLLSDLLCRVLDLADFVRNTHPEPAFVQAADLAFTNVYEYMNVLNTTTELYDSLKRTMDERGYQLKEDERSVGRTLLADFEKSGINLPQSSKQKFISLSSDIARLGRDFVNAAAEHSPMISTHAQHLQGMEQWTLKNLRQSDGKVYFPVRGPLGQHALQTVSNHTLRYDIYMARNRASRRQIDLLEQMLRARGELAQLVGRPSYAAVAVGDKMAQTPEAVKNFLESMMKRVEPMAKKELEKLRTQKRLHKMGKQASTELYPWDQDYYSHSLVKIQKKMIKDQDISEYFSLGTVMQGLSRLFTRLFGVRFVPAPTAPGEIWNGDVRRLDVISEEEGHIAVVYCDLFQRQGKNPNPAHFTVRCSRALDEDEIVEYDLIKKGDGMATAVNEDGVLYQLPTIALICDFATPRGYQTPLLSLREVNTLFHEMGHAIHSILGRTRFHEVAGTRCATDFAEFPSVLMEYFAQSPEVMKLFARHHRTDAPLPMDLFKNKLLLSSMLDHTETYYQIMWSILDQELHSEKVLKRGFSSSQIYQDLESEYSLFDPLMDVQDVSWQGYFTHLFGYGGFYYSYMLDKCIADKVWNKVFKENPLSRKAGERYKETVLQWGGARSPWKCLAELLQKPYFHNTEIAELNMKTIGKWGLEA